MLHYVLFSGGFDSTLIVLNLCNTISIDDDTIILVTVKASYTGKHKLMKEQVSRDLTVDYIKRINRFVKIETITITADIDVSGDRDYGRGGLPQPGIWLANIIPILISDSKLYMGYIKGDDALLHLQDMTKMFDAHLSMLERHVKLELPLINRTKASIIKELIIKHREVLDWVVSCEGTQSDGDDISCSTCIPCNHLQNALIQLTLPRYDKVIRDVAVKMLYDRFGIIANVGMNHPRITTYIYDNQPVDDNKDATQEPEVDDASFEEKIAKLESAIFNDPTDDTELKLSNILTGSGPTYEWNPDDSNKSSQDTNTDMTTDTLVNRTGISIRINNILDRLKRWWE